MEEKAMNKKLIVLLAIIFFLIGGVSAKILSSSNETVLAINVEKTIDNMTVNNPIKIILEEKIRQVEEKRTKEEERRRLEEIRLEEERRLEEVRLLEEERLAEEKDSGNEQENYKIAYLTFDDGPSNTVTPMVLDILAEYDIKATFLF